jgi:hypothetical protein
MMPAHCRQSRSISNSRLYFANRSDCRTDPTLMKSPAHPTFPRPLCTLGASALNPLLAFPAPRPTHPHPSAFIRGQPHSPRAHPRNTQNPKNKK